MFKLCSTVLFAGRVNYMTRPLIHLYAQVQKFDWLPTLSCGLSVYRLALHSFASGSRIIDSS